MFKKILVFSSMFLMLSLVASPILAETSPGGVSLSSPAIVDVSVKIACVGAAVATREAALGSAVSTHADTIKAAYGTRATDLAAAYTKTTIAEVRTGRIAAWSLFKSSKKSANRAWQTSRNNAWSVFRTTAMACRAQSGISDSSYSNSEVKGE